MGGRREKTGERRRLSWLGSGYQRRGEALVHCPKEMGGTRPHRIAIESPRHLSECHRVEQHPQGQKAMETLSRRSRALPVGETAAEWGIDRALRRTLFMRFFGSILVVFLSKGNSSENVPLNALY